MAAAVYLVPFYMKFNPLSYGSQSSTFILKESKVTVDMVFQTPNVGHVERVKRFIGLLLASLCSDKIHYFYKVVKGAFVKH